MQRSKEEERKTGEEEPAEAGESDQEKEPSGVGESDLEEEEPSGVGERDLEEEEPAEAGESDQEKEPSGVGESGLEEEESDLEEEGPAVAGESDLEEEEPAGAGKSGLEEEEPAGAGESDLEDGDEHYEETAQGAGADDDEGEDSDGEQQKDKVGGDDNGKNNDAVKTFSKGGTSFPDRKCVPGIIYLGHIPPRMRPKHLRNMLSVYGEIGRIFLQPEDRQVRRKKKKSGLRRCDFTEGWVEFRDKHVAKRVAASLHNTPMGTKRRQRYYSDLWSIKYLHRFQWTHLSERLAYEQTVLQQRLRTEVSQAKRETNFYLNNVDRSDHLEKLRRKRKHEGQQVEEKTWDFTQRQTEEEIHMRKKKKKNSVTQKHLDKARLIQEKSQSNISLLAKIFNTNKSD